MPDGDDRALMTLLISGWPRPWQDRHQPGPAASMNGFANGLWI
ncbi:hypothetical protein D779_2851 [Imhoffiella purpurea]|uniref:Uncharacterized protein n=1 Tax=Imhoffiella purpurea TaxID=1249627 RepID=W9VUW2_9GAMM|nr:hypothetical protein D779_2851 [Imhoffiella purpurea]